VNALERTLRDKEIDLDQASVILQNSQAAFGALEKDAKASAERGATLAAENSSFRKEVEAKDLEVERLTVALAKKSEYMEALSKMSPATGASGSAHSHMPTETPLRSSQASYRKAQLDMGVSRIMHSPSRPTPSPMQPSKVHWDAKWRAGVEADRQAHAKELASEASYLKGSTPVRTPLHQITSSRPPTPLSTRLGSSPAAMKNSQLGAAVTPSASTEDRAGRVLQLLNTWQETLDSSVVSSPISNADRWS